MPSEWVRIEATAVPINLSSTIDRQDVVVDGPCDPGHPCATATASGAESHDRMDHSKEDPTTKVKLRLSRAGSLLD